MRKDIYASPECPARSIVHGPLVARRSHQSPTADAEPPATNIGDICGLAALVLLAAAGPFAKAGAQSIYAPNKIVEMVQAAAPPEIDGVLDEDIWTNAAMVSDLHQMDPIEYSVPSERSEFYLAYDQDAL